MTFRSYGLGYSASANFVSRDGYSVELHSPSWRLSKDVIFRVVSAAQYLEPAMYESYVRVLCFFARENSPSYVASLHYALMNYFQTVRCSTVFNVDSIISFRVLLGKKQEPVLAVFRTFLRKWVDIGYVGVPEESIGLLKKWRLSGITKGNPILSLCPESGPLTDMEMDAVLCGITDAYQVGKITTFQMSLAMSIVMTGRRATQMTALKTGDLIERSDRYFLRVPRAKQRHEGGWRKNFKEVSIVKDLWSLLRLQSKKVLSEFRSLSACADDMKDQLPLFPHYEAFDPGKDLKTQLLGDGLHMRTAVLQRTMLDIAKQINVKSERTGKPIRINAYRFRYTLGTNLAREGTGEYVIAEALDHSDTQHSGVYVKNLPDIVERIDKAVAYQLAPLAQAFQGVIIKSADDAFRGDDPRSLISDGVNAVGNCGSYSFCSSLSPVSCYTCSHFQPWLDGPHEYVLDQLIKERERISDLTGDLKVASVNDRLILAVSDLVLRCREVRRDSLDE